MSSLETSAAITDILRQQYRATLLEIKRHLTNDQKEDLRFYCTDNIPEAETMEILEVFRSLENVQKISWEDVGFLKKGLYAVRRLDLVEILTGFENKRDLTKLIVEIVDDSLASKDGRHSLKPEDIERGWSAANELYCWMQRHQISWKEFCVHLKDQYNSVNHQHSSEASSVLVKSKIAEVVQQLKENPLFLKRFVT